jgi:hypothetical protein
MVMGIVSALVGVVLILNAIFLWFPPAPTDDPASAGGRKVVIRAIGVFGILSLIFSLKMFGVF